VRRTLVIAAILSGLVISTATAASPFPGTKTTADRTEWRKLLHWPSACENDWRRGREPYSGIVLQPTATVRWFVQAVCIQGAYQSTQLLYLVDRGLHAVGPISLHTYRDPGNGNPKLVRERYILGTLEFNPRTGRLVVFDKFRGIGDCGIYSVFQLKKTYFIPRAIRAKLNCNGKPPFDPKRWPSLPAPHRP
jgi:hypothetical protein